eukprot:6286574-Ditylum_brightwellii.AAC.1
MKISTVVHLISSTAFGVTALSISSTSTSDSMVGNRIRNSLGANTLRKLAKRAARQDEINNLDLGGISWLEHINLVVGTRPQAETFYEELLGFSADRSKSFHVNLGQQQFHLAPAKEGDTKPQIITGSVGLVVPDLDS